MNIQDMYFTRELIEANHTCLGITLMEETPEEVFMRIGKQRKEGKIKAFKYRYGTRFKMLPAKIKKGYGKGTSRMRKVLKVTEGVSL